MGFWTIYMGIEGGGTAAVLPPPEIATGIDFEALAPSVSSSVSTLTLPRFTAPEVWPRNRAFSFEDDLLRSQLDDAFEDVQDIINNIIIITGSNAGAIGATFDGGGSEITALSSVEIFVPFNCTISYVTLLADQQGSIAFDVKKCALSDYPTGLESIVDSAAPEIDDNYAGFDNTLTGWTTTIAAGDVIRFTVTSVEDITRCSIQLKVDKT